MEKIVSVMQDAGRKHASGDILITEDKFREKLKRNTRFSDPVCRVWAKDTSELSPVLGTCIEIQLVFS